MFNQEHLINVRNADMYSPLHLAVICKNDELVTHLLKCKGNPCQIDKHGNTALHLAVEHMVGPALLESLIHSPNSNNLMDLENYGKTFFVITNNTLLYIMLTTRFGVVEYYLTNFSMKIFNENVTIQENFINFDIKYNQVSGGLQTKLQ